MLQNAHPLAVAAEGNVFFIIWGGGLVLYLVTHMKQLLYGNTKTRREFFILFDEMRSIICNFQGLFRAPRYYSLGLSFMSVGQCGCPGFTFGRLIEMLIVKSVHLQIKILQFK